MGLYETSNFSIFTFINASDLKFCTRSYSSCVYCMMRFKGSNGKVCKMITLHFRTLLKDDFDNYLPRNPVKIQVQHLDNSYNFSEFLGTSV